MDTLTRSLTQEPKAKGRAGVPVAWASTRGAVRTENQDRLLVAYSRSGLVVAILADGMGGMRDGARAAALATAAVGAYCMASSTIPPDRVLDGALRFANDEVYRLLRGDGGAALVVAAWTQSARYVAHAGDARAYFLGTEGGLEQVTIDDTLKAQLAQLGRAADTEAPIHSQLMQFIGVGDSLQPHVSRVPDGGRGLLLTTDGVHSLPHAVMEWIVRTSIHLAPIPERLAAASEWNGGRDNASVVAISFQNGAAMPVTAGLAEFWVPGGHVVAVPLQAPSPFHPTRPALQEGSVKGWSEVGPSLGRRSRTKNSDGSRKKRKGKPEPKTGEFKEGRERQLPTVSFNEAITTDVEPGAPRVPATLPTVSTDPVFVPDHPDHNEDE